MTLTIHLPAEVEKRLMEKAHRQGQDAETVAAAVLAEALEIEALEASEAIDGIQRGLDDFDAGRYRSFAEFAAEQRERHRLSQEA